MNYILNESLLIGTLSRNEPKFVFNDYVAMLMTTDRSVVAKELVEVNVDSKVMNYSFQHLIIVYTHCLTTNALFHWYFFLQLTILLYKLSLNNLQWIAVEK